MSLTWHQKEGHMLKKKIFVVAESKTLTIIATTQVNLIQPWVVILLVRKTTTTLGPIVFMAILYNLDS